MASLMAQSSLSAGLSADWRPDDVHHRGRVRGDAQTRRCYSQAGESEDEEAAPSGKEGERREAEEAACAPEAASKPATVRRTEATPQ